MHSPFQNVIYIFGFVDECDLKHIMGTSLGTTLGMGTSLSLIQTQTVLWDNLQSDLTYTVCE
jgi:hypothetical protein